MDHKKHYDRLIETRKLRQREKGIKYERHHIIMKSMGGSNNEDNLVYLTPREHFIAHRLLWLIHRNKKSAHAFKMMCYRNKKWSSKIYEELRSKLKHDDSTKKKISDSRIGVPLSDAHKRACSKAQMGNTNRRGKPTSEETRKKQSEVRKGKPKPGLIGKKLTEEHKQKLSKAKKGIPTGRTGPTGRPAWNKGLKGISTGPKGKKFTKEHKLKLSERKKGKPWTIARRNASKKITSKL